MGGRVQTMMDGTKMECKRVRMVRRMAETARVMGGIVSEVVEEASECRRPRWYGSACLGY